jgi:hypothetical protein
MQKVEVEEELFEDRPVENSCTWQKVWWSRNLGRLSYYVELVAGYDIS